MPRTNYALQENSHLWLRHPVLGDPSFDSFVRNPNNPIVRGKAPHEWPVNGTLFRDPKSGHWFCYVGFYAEGYVIAEGTTRYSGIYRSKDRGASWESLGPIFEDNSFHVPRLPASGNALSPTRR